MALIRHKIVPERHSGPGKKWSAFPGKRTGVEIWHNTTTIQEPLPRELGRRSSFATRAPISRRAGIPQLLEADADSSRTAPTNDHSSATVVGELQLLNRSELEAQIADLVMAYKPDDGWRLSTLGQPLFAVWWCDILVGYRLPIMSFDLKVKLSQEQLRCDRAGIVRGLMWAEPRPHRTSRRNI